MVAVSRDSRASLLAGLDKGSTLLNHNLLSIDGDFDLGGLPRGSGEGTAGGIVGKNSTGGGVQAPQKTLPHHGVGFGADNEPAEGEEGGGGSGARERSGELARRGANGSISSRQSMEMVVDGIRLPTLANQRAADKQGKKYGE